MKKSDKNSQNSKKFHKNWQNSVKKTLTCGKTSQKEKSQIVIKSNISWKNVTKSDKLIKKVINLWEKWQRVSN